MRALCLGCINSLERSSGEACEEVGEPLELLILELLFRASAGVFSLSMLEVVAEVPEVSPLRS